MEVEEGVIRRGRRPHSFKIIPSLKTWLKHAYLHRSIDVKFIFDSARLGLSSSANILQIADVVLRVVFLLFLPCFYLFASPSSYSWNEWNDRHFCYHNQKTTQTTQPRPQVFSVNGNQHERFIFDVISSLNTKIFQIWSSVTGYGELNVCF